MFSGLLSIVDGSFENAEKMTLLHNDLWRFDADSGSEVATRVAACGSNIQRPSIIRPSRPYPGPRFGAATWVHEQGGWMFGGIGRRYSSYRGFEYGDNCNLDDIVGSTAVTNMCDVWQLTPGEGFRLVAACERDLPELNDAGLVPSTIVPMGLGPTAGILTAGWTGLTPGSSSAGDRAGAGTPAGGQSLWMFGGVTDGMRGIRRYRAARRDTARVRGRPLPVCQSHHVRYLGAQRTGADCSSRHTVSERGLHRGSLAL